MQTLEGLRALQEGNSGVLDKQSMVNVRRGAGSRCVYLIDPIEHMPYKKGKARREPEWNFLQLRPMAGTPLALIPGRY